MNDSTLFGVALVVAAYALGAIPFGVVFARWIGGIDPRTQGSRNIGSTNVLRVAGPGAGLLTLIADGSKGAVAVTAAYAVVPASSVWAELAGIGAVAGHVFPPWSRFRGGKGVATGIGALIALSPIAGAVVLGVWSAVVIATRYVSLGSVTAAATLPIVAVVSGMETRLFTTVVPAIVIVRHWENLVRLWQGTESKLGTKAT